MTEQTKMDERHETTFEIEDAPQQQMERRRPQVVHDITERESATISQPMIASEEVGEIFAALAMAQGQFRDIERTLTAKIHSQRANYSYAYAPLSEVLNAVRPALSEHGIAIMQFPHVRQHGQRVVVSVRTYLGHKSGQWLYNDLAVACVSAAPQDIGSAITYARRYGLMSVTGVAPDYDDDGFGANPPPPKPAQRKSDKAEKVESKPKEGPKPIGSVVEVVEKGNGAIVKLDTGFQASSTDVDVIKTAKSYQSIKNAVIELRTRESSDPSRYAPIIVEMTLVKNA